MASNGMRSVLDHLQRAVLLRDERAGDDAQLLEAFFQQGSEIALEVLLRRHGPMVMGVCRRVLQNAQDAEDAFQATFLVLVRKGSSLHKMHLIGNWLYGVAYRCALHIRSANLRRRAYERQVVDMPEPAVPQDNVAYDLRPLLDRELDRLPEKYRVLLVLCDLEGRQRRAVARQLGLPEGTLSSRLATARRLLAKRLARRGVILSGGGLAVVLAQQAQAAVPREVANATFQAAAKLGAGQALTSLGVSAGVMAAFKGVMKTMLLSKLKMLLGCVLGVGLIAGALGSAFSAGGLQISAALTSNTGPQEPAANSKENTFANHLQSRSWTLKGINPKKRTITICDKPNGGSGLVIVFNPQNGPMKPAGQKGARLEGLQLAKEAKVFVDGRPAKLTDLKVGMTLLLKIAQEKIQVAEIQAVSQAREDQYFVDAVNLKNNTITVRINNSTVELHLAKDAKMIVETVLPGGNQPQTVEGPVTEVARGTPVHLQMAVEEDRLVIRVLKISQ